jgi:hypothetical protein
VEIRLQSLEISIIDGGCRQFQYSDILTPRKRERTVFKLCGMCSRADRSEKETRLTNIMVFGM